ncbi:putative quinol monooxygenase [Nitratireductor sp. StC3]|uniref:putative quinol monooxygenase n=1 Tax=Nitratireductor sp. StC3 TaxID=2126741 RepID=UPI000D0D5801|nr:putative quinol monooxygenase [Nitratireductor sp. StC3]PSM16795.1 antibiotic biosynthesis monooxygenase [Nitratireductor sp. StC3]
MMRLIATFTPRAGAAENVRAILRATAEASRREAGVLAYDLYAPTEGGDTLITIESYTDAAAFEAHLASAHVVRAQAALDGLLAHEAAVQTLDPLMPTSCEDEQR